MIAKVEVGQVEARTEGGRVIIEASRGPACPPVVLDLSPLAAHNLGIELPELAQEAADQVLAEVMSMPGFMKTTGEEDPEQP